MLDVSRRIPWSAVSLFGFEWTLLEGPSGADLLFAANTSTGGRDILAGRHPVTGFVFDQDSPEWQAISEFCRRWAQPGNELFYGADDVWFEFDVAGAGTTRPAPSFFFGPRVGLGNEDTAIARTRAILHEGFGALLGGSIGAAPARTLDQCLEALPRQARVFQAGLMLSRPGSPFRICVDNLSTNETVECVRRLRGEVASSQVAAVIESVERTVLSIKPAFDIAATVGPRVGLECYAAIPQRASLPDAWKPLLDLLADAGICSLERREVLLNLPQIIRSADCCNPWPVDRSAEFQALLGRERALSVKIHHIKLSVESTRPVSAKAYVALENVWLA
jgi:hypothetical protein